MLKLLLFVIIVAKELIFGGYGMSGIQGVSAAGFKFVISADNTGYAALGGLVLTNAAVMTKNKSVRKLHKPLAFITTGLTLLHLGIIIHNRNEWKKQSTNFDKIG